MNCEKRGKRLNRYLLIGPVIFFVFLTGCEKRTQHRLLTFFFTGVPPLEEESEVVDEAEMAPPGTPVRRKGAPKPTIFSHAPFQEKRCDQCHEISSALGFRLSGQKRSGLALSTGGNLPGMLVAPAKALCIRCHTYLSAPDTFTQGLWLHAPAAQGNCMVCHRPHESKNPFLLNEPLDTVCIRCHKKGLMMKSREHQKSTDCIACHNPHLGKNRNMLKKDFKEVGQPVKPASEVPKVS